MHVDQVNVHCELTDVWSTQRSQHWYLFGAFLNKLQIVHFSSNKWRIGTFSPQVLCADVDPSDSIPFPTWYLMIALWASINSIWQWTGRGKQTSELLFVFRNTFLFQLFLVSLKPKNLSMHLTSMHIGDSSLSGEICWEDCSTEIMRTIIIPDEQDDNVKQMSPLSLSQSLDSLLGSKSSLTTEWADSVRSIMNSACGSPMTCNSCTVSLSSSSDGDNAHNRQECLDREIGKLEGEDTSRFLETKSNCSS